GDPRGWEVGAGRGGHRAKRKPPHQTVRGFRAQVRGCDLLGAAGRAQGAQARRDVEVEGGTEAVDEGEQVVESERDVHSETPAVKTEATAVPMLRSTLPHPNTNCHTNFRLNVYDD